ncbi:hypothetical protein [Specibacter cremeus]|uniref:hypothetical protein n=1 Tax=Specibacter cremeus TaxID=1629051 RepID=UPI000F791BED|nr:hypothetical protein [Specibacter cremeus]
MLTQLAAVVSAAEAVHEEPWPLIAPPFVIGATMLAIFLFLAFITFSFSNLGNRHEATTEHSDPHRQHTNKHDHGQGQAVSNH